MNYDAVPFVGYPDQVVKRGATIENRIISQMGCNFTVQKLKRIDKSFVIKVVSFMRFIADFALYFYNPFELLYPRDYYSIFGKLVPTCVHVV